MQCLGDSAQRYRKSAQLLPLTLLGSGAGGLLWSVLSCRAPDSNRYRSMTETESSLLRGRFTVFYHRTKFANFQLCGEIIHPLKHLPT